MSEKNKIIPALFSALLAVFLFFGLHEVGLNIDNVKEQITVGFICDGDESRPFSENFLRVVDSLEMQYGSDVNVIKRTNIPPEEADHVIEELVEAKCDIIFSDSANYSDIVKASAQKHTEVQFCQAFASNANDEPVLKNYHTFTGEIYQGRYISGRIAGLKLKELIASGAITKDQAVIGYVGAYPCAQVVSGYTAFFLGVREECPTAVMKVRYTNDWSDYSLENEAANKLISEGAVIISQHSDTIGPAVACETSHTDHPVFHIGYNQDMIGVAPNTSIIGTSIDWTPYISSAIEAVMTNKPIEKVVKGHVHGNDIGAGFEQDWVRMLDLNYLIAPKDAETVMNECIEEFKKGSKQVFIGNYTGADPDDSSNTIDLSTGYPENKNSSSPTFNYILKDVITIESD